ncbi:hypothetical protein Tco_1081484 [Tanacetum coccineum]|uniref:Uncharacterized protein n=1 Tax=Tanacetum coccineum TaxID=301880 RepID=A0ABQ5HYZ8_9ASTR
MHESWNKMKGKSMDTNFGKPSILGKPPLQTIRNKPVMRQSAAFKSKRKHVLPLKLLINALIKPTTPHSWPKVRESIFARHHHVNALGPSWNSSKNVSQTSPIESLDLDRVLITRALVYTRALAAEERQFSFLLVFPSVVSPNYPKAMPSDPIVQSVDINTKSTSYAGAVGASTKEQPKVNFNVRPLVVDLIFNGVNISIPRKVVKKGRSSFARCLIKINSKAELVDVVTIGIPSLSGDDFTKETIHVVSPPIITTSNVVAPTMEKSNDGFQTMGKKKKRKGKFKSTNGGQFAGPSVKHNVRYEPKSTTSAPKN